MSEAAAVAEGSSWTPTSWQALPTRQQPEYPDRAALDRAIASLSQLPPLVTSWEVEGLRAQLADAAAGNSFLLQGGDCAETFEDCTSAAIANKLKILLQMSLVLVHGGRKRVIRVGRFGGQYAKPRSEDREVRGGVSLPSYRGDLINHPPFTLAARTPDPELLLRGYERAALTVNFIRALIDGGFADLHHPEYWDLDFVRHSPLAAEYQRMVEAIGNSLRFMETLAGQQIGTMRRIDFFTSHEALHLHYEQAQTRRVPHRTGWYNLATHFPWIGVRTADPGGAHIEFMRGIANPLGMKVGTSMPVEQVLALADVLDPQREPGRLTLIHRFGVNQLATHLPPLVEAFKSRGHGVLWVCDPMHGNTETTADGTRTRRFEHILSELEQSFDIHARLGSRLGGVHFELTGENVTECIGGARGLAAEDLKRDYRTQVDPRLNYEQSLEMAMLLARQMARAS